MINKKILIIGWILFIFIFLPIQSVQASSSWIKDAIDAGNGFLDEEIKIDDKSMLANAPTNFENAILGINRILLVLLFGLSVISLAVIGVKYMMSGADPGKRKQAQDSLRTTFVGMAYGFGAFTIWTILMSVVRLILSSMK